MTNTTALSAYRLPILFCLFSTIAVFLAGELTVRLLAPADEDGNRMFRGRQLEPYRLPIRRVESAVRIYQDAPTTMIIYDANLGWAPRPGAVNQEAAHNEIGIRVDTPSHGFETKPATGVRRIAIFGDSFAYGSEVQYQDTWAHRLEQSLRADGTPAEVMNFGVPGYGTDQAFLRWLQAGIHFLPDTVVFGLQLENLNRNVNLIRPLYIPSIDLPFSKPRFIDVSGRLEVINRPPIPPQRLPETLARIDGWDLRDHEAFYSRQHYRSGALRRFALIGFLQPAIRERFGGRRPDDLTPDKLELAFRILSEFEASVARHGATFLVAHLPRQSDLRSFRSTGTLHHSEFLRRIVTRFRYIETIEALSRKADAISFDALFRPGGHYTAAGNVVVGDLVLNSVRTR